MKSISFTVLKDELLSGAKIQTCRCLFIPKYEVGEEVLIVWKEDKKKTILYKAQITNLYPKQLKDIDEIEAKLDGFNSIEEMQQKVMEINNLKSLNSWCFIIRFRRTTKNLLLDYS